jgi:oxygen-independent coproporphyrinogen III oxidase
MSGIYFHIPFCKTRCSYCDFFSSTRLHYGDRLIESLKKELIQRKGYLNDRTIRTIYFGGGTPSLMLPEQIGSLVDEIKNAFTDHQLTEITVEANPDDLNREYVSNLNIWGINRLSIGVQSFDDYTLNQMNRRHNSFEAIRSVEYAQKSGFNNISIDLIYGWPGVGLSEWKKNLEQAMQLNIQHISCYHLTYHEETLLQKKLDKGSISEISEQESFRQYQEMVECLEKKGFNQYEISNFALPGFESKHNSSYWDQSEYLGVGPSAHSFNSNSRYWNIGNLELYLKAVKTGQETGQMEVLTPKDKYNDFVITSLRTRKGISPDSIRKLFGEPFVRYFEQNAEKYLLSDHLRYEGQNICLTQKGMFVSDMIMEACICIKEL